MAHLVNKLDELFIYSKVVWAFLMSRLQSNAFRKANVGTSIIDCRRNAINCICEKFIKINAVFLFLRFELNSLK
jgi:hypothetical protein